MSILSIFTQHCKRVHEFYWFKISILYSIKDPSFSPKNGVSQLYSFYVLHYFRSFSKDPLEEQTCKGFYTKTLILWLRSGAYFFGYKHVIYEFKKMPWPKLINNYFNLFLNIFSFPINSINQIFISDQ